MMPSAQETSKRQRAYLMLIYTGWALLLLILGTLWLGRVAAQVGLTYGGFVWTHDPTLPHSFWVGPELWRAVRASPSRLRVQDEIVTANGRSPWRFGEVYATEQAGALVTYEVDRDGQPLTIQEPVEVFTWDDFVLSHGLLYAAGLAYIFSGLILLRRTQRRDFALFAFMLLAAAGAWMSHSEVAGIHRPYVGHGLFELLTYTPALPLTGAILLNFALLFPTPSKLLQHAPWLPYAGYGLAIVLMALYTATLSLDRARLHSIANLAMYAYAVTGILLTLNRSIHAYVVARRTRNTTQRQVIEVLSGAWPIAIVVFLLLGVFPLFLTGLALIPFEIIITLVALFPVMMVYAMGNAEMIDRLQREIVLKQQYADAVQELQNVREQTLHEIADNLHDQFIPDLRGLHFSAIALRNRLQAQESVDLSREAGVVAHGLTRVTDQARGILAGVKPIAWDETDLAQALEWLVTSARQSSRGQTIALDTTDYAGADPAAVQEALYWIARSALSNAQEHARASRVAVRLCSTPTGTSLEIDDDGAGIDPAQAAGGGRRRLGLANMRLRAAAIGATLTVDSQPDRGTRVHVLAPRAPEGDSAGAAGDRRKH
jgi:signal transduction histidine kinase